MRRRHHYIFFVITALLSVACLLLIPHTNVNSDMSKYLPDDSQMKHGMALVVDEFGGMPSSSGDVRAMVKGLDEAQREQLAEQMRTISDVEGVNYLVSDDGSYTLFNLIVPQRVDQKSLGQSLQEQLPYDDVVIETSQDGATPPLSVVIIAVILILVILFLMAQAWIEPLLILLTTGFAVLLNMGTNALLPSVSITTNFIGSILQVVLSLDYCIVLVNRYRQEQGDNQDRDFAVQAANTAIRRSYPSILSSALTTVVGLIVLCFMRLKIGTDMGVVLAKGVICSLICTFTVLPSLMMLMRRSLIYTKKKAFVLPTDRLERRALRLRYPLAIFSILLFGFSFYYAQKTPIYFSANGESKINKIFPKINPVVLIYDTNEGDKVLAMADSLLPKPFVKSVFSYPTLLQRPYSADEVADAVRSMLAEAGQELPSEFSNFLTPEITRMLYYMQSGADQELKIEFLPMMQFVSEHCINNPLFADAISDDMRSQMELLRTMLESGNEATMNSEEETFTTEEPVYIPVPEPVYIPAPEPVKQALPTVAESVSALQSLPADTLAQDSLFAQDSTLVQDSTATLDSVASPRTLRKLMDNKITLAQYVENYYLTHSDDSRVNYLLAITNSAIVNQTMKPAQISTIVGSTPGQTKMVFSFDKKNRKQMSPLEYCHLLTDDLFNRRMISGMVSDDQKAEVRLITNVMELASKNTKLSAAEIAQQLRHWIPGITTDAVQDVILALNTVEVVEMPTGEVITRQPLQQTPAKSTLRSTAKRKPVVVVAAPKTTVSKKQKQAAANDPAQIFTTLMTSDQRYTATEMANNFHRLGQTISPEDVSLLYAYYGSINCRDSLQRLTMEQLLDYMASRLVDDPRMASRIDSTSRVQMKSIPDQVSEGVKQLRGKNHSLFVILTDLPDESEQTYQFIENLREKADSVFDAPTYLIGESVMYDEMKNGFSAEQTTITLLTLLAIFLIIAISFRSLVVPTILVMTVMTAVYVNVIFSGLLKGDMLYLSYLIVQSILMGATIDYGILFTNYYKENRRHSDPAQSVKAAYHGSIFTIMTSGLIMVAAPGVMAMFVDDVMISAIVGSLSIGAFVAIFLIMVVLPGVLVACDRWVAKDTIEKRTPSAPES